MSQFSRVKKNSDLYNKIVEEDKTKIIESSLRDYERRTTESHLDESKYQASRYRKNQTILEKSNIEALDEPLTESNKFLGEENTTENDKEDRDNLSKKEILRDRDLLEEFIEEVKHYNINRGLRNVQDTQMNILQNLGKTPKVEEFQESKVEPETHKELENQKTDQELTQEIQAIIYKLDKDEELEHEVTPENDSFVFTPLDKDKDEELSTIFQEIEGNSEKPKIDTQPIQKVEPEKFIFKSNYTENNDKVDLDANIDAIENNKRDYKSSELLELTQTLNLKLDLQEAELEKVSEKVSVLDRILTFFVVFLVIALIISIAYGIFWVYKERGGF